MSKDNCFLQKFGYERFERVIDMIGGKWKLRIIYMLSLKEVLRYGQLKKLLSPISHKMFTAQLKELEKSNLIIRCEYPQIPPRVEYSLTKMGRNLEPIVAEIYKWIIKYNL